MPDNKGTVEQTDQHWVTSPSLEEINYFGNQITLSSLVDTLLVILQSILLIHRNLAMLMTHGKNIGGVGVSPSARCKEEGLWQQDVKIVSDIISHENALASFFHTYNRCRYIIPSHLPLLL